MNQPAQCRRLAPHLLQGAGSQFSPQRVSKQQELAEGARKVLDAFVVWLRAFGEVSFDYQSFYAGPFGGRAKSLYYRHPVIGVAAVAPMVFFEAFLPAARQLYHHPVRFPIADAHYAMGFGFRYDAMGDPADLTRAVHFLNKLEETRCSNFDEYCWGYPFDWVTLNGVIKQQTPLITTTPYVYEAFLQVSQLPAINHEPTEAGVEAGRGKRSKETGGSRREVFDLEQRERWKQVLRSIVRHTCVDIKDFKTSEAASTCSYTPFDRGGVINAAAYRAFLLTSASRVFDDDEYWRVAERNLNFVLEAQNPDGSWPYAVDGVRDFIDHFHTCFVMKALAKIHALTGHEMCLEALSKGVDYYLKNLFDEDGLPRPFSRAPRLTVYKRELYDCAECINLCLLLRDRFPQLQTTLDHVVEGILNDWIIADGCFRSRRLFLGWDNVPMHRWGQSQMFRSLAYYLREVRREDGRSASRHWTSPPLTKDRAGETQHTR